MISPSELESRLEAFVQLKGLGTERERIGISIVKMISAEVHKLIRGEVIQAKRESMRLES